MYDTAVVSSILLIVSNVVVEYQAQNRLLFVIGIFWTTSFASSVFVLPRLLKLWERQRNMSHTGQINIPGMSVSHGVISTTNRADTER